MRAELPTGTNPPRVLFLDHTARLGGGEIALANLIGELARGHDAFVQPRVCLFEDGPLAQRLRAGGIACEVLELGTAVRSASKDGVGLGSLGKAAGAVGFVRRLAKHIRAAEVDLVYCNSLKADILGGFAARLAGVPCVWHVRDRIEADYLPALVVPVFRKLAAWIPAGVAANSQHTLATLHLPAGKPTRVVYSGVVPPDEVADEPAGPQTVGLVGRLAPWKGQHVFLEAAALVRRALPGVRFRLIGSALFGEDDYERRLRARAGQADLAGAIAFEGFQSDIFSALAALNLVVHASVTPEPFGQVVVEAMAARRAVIATDGGGVRETVVNGETGLLVGMGNETQMASDMADAMLRLLRDEVLRKTMAAAGRERATGVFHIEKTAVACRELIEEVLERSGR
jgi:glycosyltransferase involved in cell wall biosynthesis